MPNVIADSCLLRIEATGQPPGAVLECVGEIDLSSVDTLRRGLDASIRSGVREVEVDLREVSFLDSSAMDALIEAQRQLASEGRTLRVRTGPWAAHLLHMVKLDRAFTVVTD
jgi:stage II sporulation protein AA (anti-sigma F factor antagonist)